MMPSPTCSGRASAALLATALASTLLLTACSGDEGETSSPEDVLATAKEELDGTSGVRVALATAKLPPGVDGVLEADGVATHAPAFDGDLTVRVNELTVEVPVVAVEGTVYAQLPFTKEFAPIEPADYGAPDPSGLLDPADGISTWLTAATGVEQGDQVRDGGRVLTSYTGTLPGDAVAAVIPSADESAEFPATFRVDDDDRLASVEVAGPFYGKGGDVDYTITLTEYGAEPEITAP